MATGRSLPQTGRFLYPGSISDYGSGVGAIATLNAGATIAERYVSLWPAMPKPGSTPREGYEIRFTETASNVYTVRLGRWSAGALTTLSSKTAFSFKVGSRLAIVEKGGVVSAWVNAESGFTELLSAKDASFAKGQSGVKGAGDILRLKNSQPVRCRRVNGT